MPIRPVRAAPAKELLMLSNKTLYGPEHRRREFSESAERMREVSRSMRKCSYCSEDMLSLKSATVHSHYYSNATQYLLRCPSCSSQ